ncbi:hypothetical protein MUP77_12930 [Candidatus Bathyarchaeota archaeon]|nr:hypothetical protein [Candidatus Bathyarchaeota archaeon]
MSKIDEACGEGREFIVILKHDKMNEAINRMLQKVSVENSVAGMLTRARYKGKQVNIFRTGKLVIREFYGKEEVVSFLEDLFK